LPGKLIQAAVFPTFLGKDSKVPAKLELKSTCGCPVNEATLRQTEITGKPIEITLTQVRFCLYCLTRWILTPVHLVVVARQDLSELGGHFTL
jgi:hypothetical protein